VVKWCDKNPQKQRIQIAVPTAGQNGTPVKPTQGERRQTPAPKEKLHGHHDNDDLLLAIRWLCQECHKAVHVEKIKQNNDLTV
jgi:hypothetical protein